MLTRRGFLGCALAAAAGGSLLEACGVAPRSPKTTPPPGGGGHRRLRASGAKLVDGSGAEFRLTGVNWFGFETSTFAPHGLWSRRLDDMLDQIAQSGFNSIRPPFSNQALEPDRRPVSIDYAINADLRDLSSLQLMDRVNPAWLIVVEGVEKYAGDGYWWGGNLAGAKTAPVRLSRPGRLAYSAHDYGPEVYQQRWFQASDFPGNLASVWTKHWAWLEDQGVAPVLLGEFGGRSVGADKEGAWQRTLVAILRDHGVSYTYWAWNPDSGDTGGLLDDDWQTVDRAKLDLLASYQWPRGG